MLDQDQLTHSSFPLGDLPNKDAVRKMAYELGLPVAGKPDSQEICFVSEAGGYREFLRKARPDSFQEGEIVDEGGKVLATHAGIEDFTVGQRKGIGLTAKSGRPLFVLKVDPAERRVVVGHEEALMATDVELKEVVWGLMQPTDEPRRVMAKIRYNMDPQPAVLYGGEKPMLQFRKPVRAVTPGQIAVAYCGKTVAAGGVIVR